jgi:hypothetical protein
MINELYELSQSLEHHKLLRSTTNPNVGKLGKFLCLLIELNNNGKPASLRLLPKEETAKLWKHNKGNHNSFPAIRIQRPLLDSTESQKVDAKIWEKAKLEEKQKILQSLDFSHVNPKNTDIRISQWSLNELSSVLCCEQPELEALKRLLTRFPRDAHCTQFYASLLDTIKYEIDRCNNAIMAVFLSDLLVGKYDEKNKKYISGCMTYFDVFETDEVPCKVISPDTSEALIRLLNFSTPGKGITGKQPELCALSGNLEEIIEDKFPNPNLPILGLTYLYSKKADTPCLTRYRLSGVEAFHASKSTMACIYDALDFLTAADRKDKSWRAIVDSNGDKPNLLLAYLTDDPQNNALLAQILDDPTDYEKEYAFDALCQ